MHHTKIVIRLLIGVWFLENTNKVVPKITELEEIFDFIIFRHGLVLLGKQMGMENGLLKRSRSFFDLKGLFNILNLQGCKTPKD